MKTPLEVLIEQIDNAILENRRVPPHNEAADQRYLVYKDIREIAVQLLPYEAETILKNATKVE